MVTIIIIAIHIITTTIMPKLL